MHHVTILGSGTSTGVPMPCCSCAVCKSSDPKNQRLRSSAFIVTSSGKNILVDTSPDLRQQALINNITNIDSCIITHEHADHTHGIDDLRPFCFGPPKKEIQIWTSEYCVNEFTQKYPYIFQRHKLFNKDKPIIGGGVPLLTLQKLIPEQSTKIQGEDFYFHLMPHGYGMNLGFIHSKMAYLTDCHEIPETFLKKLKQSNLELLILDCINRRKHKTHLSFDRSIEYLKKIDAKLTVLTHFSHDFDQAPFEQELKSMFNGSVIPAYDGLTLEYH